MAAPAQEKRMADIVAEAITKHVEREGLSKDAFEQSIQKVAKDFIRANKSELESAIVKDAQEILNIPRKIEIIDPDKSKLPKEVFPHAQFDELVKAVNTKIPVLLVGMPGTGKTSAAEQVAGAMGLDFHSISVGVQTTKSDILGFIDAGGGYKPTSFRQAFENGGLFLMDEVDAGNPNVLIVINSAISNGFCNFPDEMVKVHDKFRFVATANTFGTGADTKFIGRNQLDEATLDRFITIDWKIDMDLESAIAGDSDWVERVRTLRASAKNSRFNLLVSPRVSIYGARLIAAGFSQREAADMTILKGKDADTKNYILQTMGL